jgi:hypothetical protein
MSDDYIAITDHRTGNLIVGYEATCQFQRDNRFHGNVTFKPDIKEWIEMTGCKCKIEKQSISLLKLQYSDGSLVKSNRWVIAFGSAEDRLLFKIKWKV